MNEMLRICCTSAEVLEKIRDAFTDQQMDPSNQTSWKKPLRRKTFETRRTVLAGY
jgi:hypothetical protein